jgi:AraC family transcriptional regulator of adaptative response/methylated-DNA-[protein]-cysteine methyltransferase
MEQTMMTVEATERGAAKTSAPDFTTDDARWQAFIHRDKRADGVFYTGVKTTGVYCRPTCAARQPLRKNVVFFASCDEAEQAGLRPCKRCHPRGISLSETHAAIVAEACRRIEAAETAPTLGELADAARLSPFHFHRLFKQATGVTPKAYADAARARRMRGALAESGSVTEAIYGAGFNSSGRFYETAPAVLGMTPTKFRSGGKGETLRFAVGQTSIGPILVAATAKGIAAIEFGSDPDAMVKRLQDRFPQANLIGGDAEFDAWIAHIVGFVERPAEPLELPLDVRGTAFQQRVWQALRQIPLGSTASYAEIAARLGQPKSARAVARACASNPVAVAIPCHRVVHTDGTLSGYRWGVERKRALLDREAAA